MWIPIGPGVSMRVTLELTRLDPPQGTATIEGQEATAFVGWLGLLRVLSDLTAAPVK